MAGQLIINLEQLTHYTEKIKQALTEQLDTFKNELVEDLLNQGFVIAEEDDGGE